MHIYVHTVGEKIFDVLLNEKNRKNVKGYSSVEFQKNRLFSYFLSLTISEYVYERIFENINYFRRYRLFTDPASKLVRLGLIDQKTLREALNAFCSDQTFSIRYPRFRSFTCPIYLKLSKNLLYRLLSSMNQPHP